MRQSQKQKSRTGRVRIVAGAWRHRFIDVGTGADLRPTPDRVRETVFNWLGQRLQGARVLDLFAGTGVLGLEALSRGAASAIFVEKNAALCRAIEAHATKFGAGQRAEIVCADVHRYLENANSKADVVFLDPPYRATAHPELCTLLADREIISDGANVYLEQDRALDLPELPEQFALTKNKTAGRVRFMLATYTLNAGV